MVVLVHGLGVGQRYFEPLARELGSDVLRPELRDPAPIEELAALLEARLDGPAALVANSMGCQIVTALAVSRPELVSSLALVGPTVDRRTHSVVRHVLRLGIDGWYEPFRLTATVIGDYATYGTLDLVRQAKFALDDRIEDRLPSVAAPTVVVRGAHDPLCPAAWAREVTGLLPDARLVTIAGAGHAVHFSHPREVAAALRGLPGMPAPRG
ncbi:MAG: alpha/beta hydrolase [Actinobacteria bacterium]|nr:alpha/beta hydrolase [Actinomycetota bacterium]